MSKLKKIGINSSIINDVLSNVLESIPGVANDPKPCIEFQQDDTPHITITFTPMEDIVNVFDLCMKIQNIVYYRLLNDFDLQKIKVDVLAK
ncbi:MAG: hypothetical protein IJP83_00520 [Mycoplasma sp.]|nr:hypothetical protein [Mycoplasma sp.]